MYIQKNKLATAIMPNERFVVHKPIGDVTVGLHLVTLDATCCSFFIIFGIFWKEHVCFY